MQLRPELMIKAALPLLLCGLYPVLEAASDTDWPVYLGDAESSQYSELQQITPQNADRLEVAWIYRSGDAGENDRSQIQCNPLVVGGILYASSPRLKLLALDAATGEEKWVFDPSKLMGGRRPPGLNRGLSYWKDGDDERILFGAGSFLHAVNARTGRLIESFGEGGRLDLRDGLGPRSSELSLVTNTPGAIFEDLIVVPTRVGEGPGPAAQGPIRAFSVRTGAEVWRFDTIPRPGQVGYESWPKDAWKTVGGANVWTGISIDEENGIIFCPTGAAAFDFWGGDRLGANLYANCLIALDGRTGERLWHYQFVRHDLWDRDLPAPPNLVTLERDGKEIPAVAQITKSGHVFVFHRLTGEPLFPIEEVATPASDLEGEEAWPWQPLPRKPAPFARQVFSSDQLNDVTPAMHREALEQFVRLRPHTPFMPPSEEGTIIFPGFDGGGEWGGAAADPQGVLYVNANEMPWILTMVNIRREANEGERAYLQNCAGCHGQNLEGSPAQNVPTLVGVSQRLKREEVLSRLLNGVGVMPSFGFLSQSQLDSVADYVLSSDQASLERGERAAGVLEVDPEAPPYTHTGYNRWLVGDGYPAVKPPWGTLNAIDLNTGEFVWSVTLGEYEELSRLGVPPTGTENYGGPVVTAGGVIFIGASRDEHFRVFDARYGRELWKYKLPAGGYATPATYSVDGRQYVAIACGGGKMGTASGDAYVAFALPRSQRSDN